MLKKCFNKLPKLIKILSGAVVTIFLSALGAPVWSCVLKPVFLFCSDFIVDLFFKLFYFYESSVFTYIAHMSSFDWLLEIKFILICIVLLPSLYTAMFIVLNKKIKSVVSIPNNDNSDIDRKKAILTFLEKMCLYLLVVMVVMMVSVCIQDIYVVQMKTNFDTKLTNARPYLTDIQYYKINADFRNIKSRKEYYAIIDDLNKIIIEK